jgi:hypothetical protein
MDERTVALTRSVLPAYSLCAGRNQRIFIVSFFESNLARLAARQSELAAQLRQISVERVRIFPSVSGNPTAQYERDSAPLALHSRYDPLKEARQTIKKSDPAGADYFVLLGFGLGYNLDALLEENSNSSNHYFIIESSLEILRAAFEARDLSSILALPHIYFAWPPSGSELAEQWRRFFDPVLAQKNVYITHLPSVSLSAGLYKAAAEIIQSQIFQTFTDINTLVDKSVTFLNNFVQNLPKAARAPGIAKFSGKFSGIPAVIVSAGPSLDKNIHELRGNEDRILILSTDTALKPLLAAGIEPHFVLTGDPSPENYRHLKGARSQKAFLVAEATAYPAVFDEFPERTLSCTFESSSLRSLSDLLGNKGTLRAWGSVATMALDFALLLQCNPVVFIGQDLAYTDGRTYCSGVCFDEDWFAGISDPDAWQQQLARIRSQRRTITVEDIFGRPVESTDKLVSYWNWMLKVFQEHPQVRFINATEGGILRDPAIIASLREVLYRYCRQDLNLRSRIQSAFDSSRESSLLYVGTNLSVLSGELAAIRDVLAGGFRLCEEKSAHSPQELLKRLEAAKQSIYFNPHLSPLLDCFNQMGNVTFLRKRNGIARQAKDPGLAGIIKDAYLEYFTSVRKALEIIDKALIQIQSALNIESSRPC